MWRWISIALIVILIGGGVVAGIMVHELQGEKFRLQSSYNRLEDENEDLQKLLDQYEQEFVPHDYYSDSIPLYANTYSNLCYFLKYEFVLPNDYEAAFFANIVDCSESAAYLEWALENAGFDAYIAVGPHPHPSTVGYHAWVIVHTEDPYKVAIEATKLIGRTPYYDQSSSRMLSIIHSNDPGFENYYNGYEYSYENIYECIRSSKSVEAWNWWEEYWDFE